MDWSDERQRRVFFEVHAGLERQGPGTRECAAKALGLAAPLPPTGRALDLGCGPGLQTVELAEMLPGWQVAGIDSHPPFIEELRASAAERGLTERVQATVGDMAEPQVGGRFDLVWSEGAAYIVGFEEALTRWRRLLREGGRIALTEAVWLTDSPPAVVRENWREYPAMADVESRRQTIRDLGFRLLGDFTLPEQAWWQHYYGPMEARLDRLQGRYPATMPWPRPFSPSAAPRSTSTASTATATAISFSSWPKAGELPQSAGGSEPARRVMPPEHRGGLSAGP